MGNAGLLGHDDARYRRYRAQLAPGTPLREGLERIRLGHTGALVVLGTNDIVEMISTGGFFVNCPFTATALRELAKLDGGIILSPELDTILWAGVHFTPDAGLPTIETGTRHRTADRIALQTNIPAVTVSAAMSTIALFMAGLRYPIESSNEILLRADQAVATLQRYRTRLDAATNSLSDLELDNLVTVADLVRVVQALAMVHRLSAEIQGYVEALGVDGRLLRLQLHELTLGLDQLTTLLTVDYQAAGQPFALDNLDYLPTLDLLEAAVVARALGYDSDLNRHISPVGHRFLAQSAQLSSETAQRVIERFGSLSGVQAAEEAELAGLPGLGAKRARAIREALNELAKRSVGE